MEGFIYEEKDFYFQAVNNWKLHPSLVGQMGFWRSSGDICNRVHHVVTLLDNTTDSMVHHTALYPILKWMRQWDVVNCNVCCHQDSGFAAMELPTFSVAIYTIRENSSK